MQVINKSTRKLGEFLGDFMSGETGTGLRRLLDRDPVNAYRVLTRDLDLGAEPEGRLARSWFRTRALFRGIMSRLTPPRRVLFGLAVVLAFMGLTSFSVSGDTTGAEVSKLWLLGSCGALFFLLVLELVDRTLVRDELEVARQLQRDILPAQAPDLPGYRFAHAYRTANEVGGDYYDFLELPDGRLALIQGDASGHGIAAGLLMAIAGSVLRLAVDLDPAPDQVLSVLNRVLCRTGGPRSFVSMFLALLTPATGDVVYVCAGHPFPALRRADGTIEELGTGSLPLGLRGDLVLTPATTVLAPGDLLLIYSDGLPEAVNRSGEPLGYDRVLAQVGSGGRPAELLTRLQTALDRHRAGEPLADDVSLVAVSRDRAE